MNGLAQTDGPNTTPESVAGSSSQSSQTSQPAYPHLLLVEADQHPTISLSWHSHSRGLVRYAARLPYNIDSQRVHLDDNVEAFAAVGGTRISKAAGHPQGCVVKAGFYKNDPGTPWFSDIDTSKPIAITIEGVAYNQPVDLHTDTALLHAKYSPEDLESCGLPGDARECFATGSAVENLNRRVRPGVDTTLGGLSASGPGSVTAALSDDGLVSYTFTFPYAMLRNLQDPWYSTLPGTFLEPFHFHVEFQVLKAGAEPLDWVQLNRNSDALQERLQREGSLSVPNTVYPPEAPEGFVPRDPPAGPETQETESEETETET
ncbi:MAG: hypothetical protein ACF8Q5_14175 [Phycisphaerales bacterium JB040]